MKWNDEMKPHHLFKSQDSKPCEVKTQQMSRGMAYAYDKIWPYDHHRRYSAFTKKNTIMLLETSFRNCTQTSSALVLGLERVYQQKDYRLMEIQ